MAQALLITDNEFERDYKITDGRIITLKLEDDLTEITFWDEDGDQLGNDGDFCFVEHDFVPNRYLLSRMYVPIKQNGLGRAALEFFKEITGAIIWARANDGVKHDDGSYLTEDAPGFVMKMQREGLIEDLDERTGNEFEDIN